LTFKDFFTRALLGAMIFLVLGITVNLFIDPYGLFRDCTGRSIHVYHNERTSKYLLSYRYVPSNFQGFLVGSSVANNLDTKRIKHHKVFNASLDGGNITELKYIAENLLQSGQMRLMILCLYQYITKDHGRKTSYIDPYEYWSMLGSMELAKLYAYKTLVALGLRKNPFNDYGFFNHYVEKPDPDYSRKEILRHVHDPQEAYRWKIHIDDQAFKDLSDVVRLARDFDVRIFGYYHPYPHDIFLLIEDDFRRYKTKIDTLFHKGDVIWDLNADAYSHFTRDFTNFGDITHLSRKGSQFVVKEIERKMNESL